MPQSAASSKGSSQLNGDAPTLRLLCSITGGLTKAQWEDVTGSTPLNLMNNCVSFTTTVSARFWLIDVKAINEATKIATEIYREAILVPFMAKFVVFCKRHDPAEARLRVFCKTDDKEDKTLESQERFDEIAKSRDVEVLEGKAQYVEFAGNLAPVMKTGDQLSLTFQAFRENRLSFLVRVKDMNQDPNARIAFMQDSRRNKPEMAQVPLCNLNLQLPDRIVESTGTSRRSTPSPYTYKKTSFSSGRFMSSIGNGFTSGAPAAETENIEFMGMSRDISAQDLDVSAKDVSKITPPSAQIETPESLAPFETWQTNLNKQPKQESNARNILEKGLSGPKPQETETWFSGEQDTSQVSISSLPEDEKSEHSVTVSSATTTSGEFNLSTTAVVSEGVDHPPKGM